MKKIIFVLSLIVFHSCSNNEKNKPDKIFEKSLEIIKKKTKNISASIEWLSLYVNLETRKVTEFENEKIKVFRDQAIEIICRKGFGFLDKNSQ